MHLASSVANDRGEGLRMRAEIATYLPIRYVFPAGPPRRELLPGAKRRTDE